MSPSSALARRVAGDARTRTLSFSALFFAVVVANAAGYRSTYPHVAERRNLVANFATNKAARILYGTGHDLLTVGGYTGWRAGGVLALFAALFGIFASARALRGEEESGRAELVLVGALDRTGAFVATLIGIALTLTGLGLGSALGALAGGLDLRGAGFFALVFLSVASVYVAVGAVTGQVFPTRRSALGASAAVLGVDFLLRIVADTTDHFSLHWLSPLGWAEEMRAFSGSHPLVLVLPIASTMLLLAVAGKLNARRDLGGAYVAAHDTTRARTGLLSSPFALALRLDRSTIASWTVAVALFAFVVGTVAKSVEKLDLPQNVRDQIVKLGGIDITRAKGFVGLTFVIFGFAIGLFVCGQLASLRDEEAEHRLETLFALPYGRGRWLQGRVVLVTLATVVCAIAAGAAVGLGVVVTGGHMTFGQGIEAGLNVIPTELLFIGAGVLFFAYAPRFGAGLLYAFVVVAFVWELFGALLSFPNWLLGFSPYYHLAPVPAKPIALVSALVMIAIAAIATGVGLARFRGRDLAGD